MRPYRCRFDRKFLGVCGGLGRFFKIDPNILRLALVFVTCLTGFFPMILIYLVAALLIPEGPLIYLETSSKKLFRLRSQALITGLCAGIARYFGFNVSLFRFAIALTTCFTLGFPILVTYAVGSFIVPQK